MVLHELCHALVEGEAGRRRPDWGLDNTGTRDEGREQSWYWVQPGSFRVLSIMP
jgi:hypothetical protein